MADELDALYEVKPDEFTALRTSLAAAAKQRGDPEATRRISAARRPTTAAWVANLLVHRDPTAKQRLAGLGDRLRAAHVEADGARIRELSRAHRALVDDLSRTAFAAAELTDPPAALRADVTATLQAAIADPEVAARLGRLTKAERWSGFGGFGDTTTVATDARQAATSPPAESGRAQPRRRPSDQARAALAAATKARATADGVLAECKAELATARLRRDDARRRLDAAEADLVAADSAYRAAKQAGRDAAEAVAQAKAGMTS